MNQRGTWQLILMAREGDRQAIDELFYSSFRPAYLILYAITADKRSSLEILAEGYVDVFQKLEMLESGSDFSETLNRYVIGRAKALFPSEDFLRLPDGCEAQAFGFRQNPPQIHDFDTLPAINLSARADEILSAFHALPLEQQVCAYLYYYAQTQPDAIADILATHENKVCGMLQKTRTTVLPQIDAVLKKSPAFRGTDAESAIPWALRVTEEYAATPDETEACRQKVLSKLVSGEILDVETQEEPEPAPEFTMQDIAPPKEHHVLRSIFSLPTLICVLVILIVIGCIVGVRQLHNYNLRRQSMENHTDRTTLTLTSTTFPSERNIFSTEYAAPTEAETTVPVTEEPIATTEAESEAPTVPEPTSPVITTTSAFDGIEFAQTGASWTITGYTGSRTRLDIPDKKDGKPITAIGDKAFYNTGVSSVSLPQSITTIGANAFGKCSALESIAIPDAVTSIGENAFSECSRLRAVTFGSSSKLSRIGARAFAACNTLSSFRLPSTVTKIGDSAFESCHALGSIRIPKSVQTIGKSVFRDCSALTSCTIDKSSELTAMTESMFEGCVALKSITIPDKVTKIGAKAFARCEDLASISFNSKLNKIENSAFSMCMGLTEVTIPGSVTSIGASAFSGCDNLQKITIPASVTSIGENAFKDCSHVVFVCPAGSAAEKYADRNHIEVEGRNSDSTYTTESRSE